VEGTSLLHHKLTATPQPIKTSTIVPNISAKYFFIFNYFMFNLFSSKGNKKNIEKRIFYEKIIITSHFLSCAEWYLYVINC